MSEKFLVEGAKRLRDGRVVISDKNHEDYLMIMTPCCGTYSKFCDGELVCRGCFEWVEPGEGDGSEKITRPELQARKQ